MLSFHLNEILLETEQGMLIGAQVLLSHRILMKVRELVFYKRWMVNMEEFIYCKIMKI